MASGIQVELPEPAYQVGTIVLALINHYTRYARVEHAYLQAFFGMDENGVYINGKMRWEYAVRVLTDPIEESEVIIISERTIITVVEEAAS